MLFRFNLVQAVTWQIIAELFRRHHESCHLRLLELHPSGGLSYVLSLFIPIGSNIYGKEICSFNMVSNYIYLCKSTDKVGELFEKLCRPDGNGGYVAAFLGESDPKVIIDQIEDLADLPKSKGVLPQTTPPVLTARLAAGLLERTIFDRCLTLLECAWHDSSGMEGSYINREQLAAYPEILAQMPAEEEDWKIKARKASRYWLIRRLGPGSSSDNSLALLDFTGKLHFPHLKKPSWDFWNEYYQNGRKLTPLINRLEAEIIH